MKYNPHGLYYLKMWPWTCHKCESNRNSCHSPAATSHETETCLYHLAGLFSLPPQEEEKVRWLVRPAKTMPGESLPV